MLTLPQSAIEQIGYYVYLLKDPIDHKVFYVGKGKGSRILSHENLLAKSAKADSPKAIKINEILSRRLNNKVEYQILRHGLTEEQAFEVESSVIDLLGLESLTNKVKSFDSSERGISDLNEILIKYTAEKVDIKVPVMLINLNATYKFGMSAQEIYDITRGMWKVNPDKASKYKYAFAVYRGIVREVFEIIKWEKSILEGRYQFEGKVVDDPEFRGLYVHKSVKDYIRFGNQNPVRYVGG